MGRSDALVAWPFGQHVAPPLNLEDPHRHCAVSRRRRRCNRLETVYVMGSRDLVTISQRFACQMCVSSHDALPPSPPPCSRSARSRAGRRRWRRVFCLAGSTRGRLAGGSPSAAAESATARRGAGRCGRRGRWLRVRRRRWVGSLSATGWPLGASASARSSASIRLISPPRACARSVTRAAVGSTAWLTSIGTSGHDAGRRSPACHRQERGQGAPATPSPAAPMGARHGCYSSCRASRRSPEAER